jgi:hypothetical protein
MNIKRIRTLKERMSEEQKRKLLVGLRRFKEEYTGNVGGETDIANADNLQTNENEFTGGDSRPQPKVIAKTFDTNADYDSYINQRRGIEMTPKERQAMITELASNTPHQATPPSQATPSNSTTQEPSQDDTETTVDDKIRIQKSTTFVDETQGADILSNFLAELELSNEKPTSGDKFFMKYETTDAFGNNTTTVIKKLREGGQFCWTAFSKYESAEEEGQPGKEEEEP